MPTELSSPSVLLKSSWQFLLKNFYKILIIASVPGIAAIISVGILAMLAIVLVSSASSLLPLIPALALLIIVVAYFQAWGSLALISFIRNPLTVSSAFKSTRNLIFRSWAIMLLSALITVGGYTTLIIPGLIFTLWFSFALIILVDQSSWPLVSLSACRDLFRGRFWPVAGRLLILFLLLIGSSLASSALSAIPIIGLLAGLVIPMFTTPLAVIYTYYLYVDLKNSPSPATSSTPLFTIFSLIGLAALTFATFGVIHLVTLGLKALPSLMANPQVFQKYLPPEFQQLAL